MLEARCRDGAVVMAGRIFWGGGCVVMANRLIPVRAGDGEIEPAAVPAAGWGTR